MKKRITKAIFDRVDLCALPMNQEANVLLYKSASGIPDIFKAFKENLTAALRQTGKSEITQNFVVDFLKMIDNINTDSISDLEKSIESINSGGRQMDEKIKELEAQLAKATESGTAKDSEIATLKSDLKKAQDAQTAQQTQIDELKKAVPAQVEDIWKGVAPQLREQFEGMQKSLQASQEKQELAELTKAVETDFKGLPGKQDEVVNALRAIKKSVKPEEFAKLAEILKSAATLIEKSSLLDEKGNRGNEIIDGTTGKFMAAVKDAVKKGEAKNEDEAMLLVAKSQPQLYQEHTQNVRKGVK